MMLVLASIFQASLFCADRLPNRLQSRDQSTDQNGDASQTCTFKDDGNSNTNMHKCKNEAGPLDLNDCQRAGQYMRQFALSSAGFQTCGVLYFLRKQNDELALFPLPDAMNATVIENTINANVQNCCVENMPLYEHPEIGDVPQISRNEYLGQGLARSFYDTPAELKAEDVEALLGEVFHPPSA